MEIRIEALQGQTVPTDTFVSMRVGDVQRQSRYCASRTYNFPNPGDGRGGFGRIEIFKRIGASTVSLETGLIQDIEIGCKDPQLGKLQLKLGVSSKAGNIRSPDEKSKKLKMRYASAQRYLTDHNLEELLAEAMREVIRDQPENPHKFLSKHIMSACCGQDDDGMKLPPISPGKLSPKDRGGMPSQQSAMDRDLVGQDHSIQRRLSERSESRSGKSGTKLPPLDPQHRSSSGGGGGPPAPLGPALKNLAPPAPAAQAGGPAPQAAQGQGLLQECGGKDFFKLASVGTWNMIHPRDLGVKPYTPPFNLLPSVGTWLAANPKSPARKGPAAGAGGETSSHEASAVVKAALDIKFCHKPSCGTWLAAIPVKIPGAPGSGVAPPIDRSTTKVQHLPSCGTWLQTKPAQVSRPWYFCTPPQTPEVQYVNGLRTVITDMDREIEDLKTQIRLMNEGKIPLSPSGPHRASSFFGVAANQAHQPTKPVAPPTQNILPVTPYYRANFKSSPETAACLKKLHALFGGPKVPAAASPTVHKAVPPPPPTSSVLPFAGYYRANFHVDGAQATEDCFKTLHKRFLSAGEKAPAAKPREAATSSAAAVATKAPADVTGSILPFKQYYDKQFKVKGNFETANAFKALHAKFNDRTVAKVVPWTHKPSIGTWLQPRLGATPQGPAIRSPSVLITDLSDPDTLNSSMSMLRTLEKEELIKAFHAEIRRKDAEIAALKKQC